jgi:Arc/MetJ-type ribon-helix-helix transcriptional regulator
MVPEQGCSKAFLIWHVACTISTSTGMPSTKKATFNLHRDVIEQLDRAVSRGAAPSKNALVERALRRELDDLRRRERQLRWQAAARDPLLLRDLAEVEQSFTVADAETARSIP